MADVFISYCSTDRTAAERVAARLGAEGLSTWWDESLIAGQAWDEAVRAELKAARVVVVLWSAASWASRWVQAEAQAGLERSILVAARLDDVMLEPPFNIVQTADLRDDHRGLDRLVAGVRRMVEAFPGAGNARPPRLRSSAHPVNEASEIRRSAPVKPRIAVLPFENLSPDPANAFFTDGMHEQILSTLASRTPDIEVVSRTTVLTYRGQALKMSRIASELGCSHVLEGSVRREGNEVRLTVQLIDAREDQHLWAQDYDRTLINALTLQAEVASEIASQLSIKLTGKARHVPGSTTDPKAYDLYLKARLARQNLGGIAAPMEAWRDIKRLLDGAIARDPQFALAYVERAVRYWYLFTSNFDASQQTLGALRADLDTALRIAPANPAVIATQGLWEFLQLDYDRARETLTAAEAAGLADPDLLQWLAVLLVRTGRHEAARTIYEHFISLDPGNLMLLMVAFTSEFVARRPKDAARIADFALARAPGNIVWRAMRANLRATFAGELKERSVLVEQIQEDLVGMEFDAEGFIGFYLEHLIFHRRYKDAQAIIDRAPTDSFILIWFDSLPMRGLGRFPIAAVRGQVDLLLGDRAAAEKDGRAVLEFVSRQDVTKWNRWFLRAIEGLGRLFVGDSALAREAARDAIRLALEAPDAVHWATAKHMAAQVFAWADAEEEAAQLLEEMSTAIPGMAPAYVTRDPTFAEPLANNARYQALSNRLEAEMASTSLE
jgi:TolB-like protein/Tfp pilus assembly protein PilF